jgi:environmental stress-induced protein Ves
MNDIQLNPSETYITTKWSGGKTSELFIYPEGANFKQGDFSLRISIATVEVDSSDFTPLPNVQRTLMVLDGTLKLEHFGHHSCELQPFEQDEFSGNWSTKSWGKVTDFNVMTKNDTKTIVQKIDLIANETLALTAAFDLQFIYVQSGLIQIGELIVSKGNSIVINNLSYVKVVSGNQFELTELILISADFNL